ncbi:MAG: glycerol-3-phosphate dehydrogenase/oxidase [Oleiphilus sp.]
MKTDAETTNARAAQLALLTKNPEQWDLVVVGGGITGAGIFREAAKLGLKVLLVEQRDFAWGTSSRSSKMVHGGLRYLGSGQFGLANDSVKERQRLMQELPGLVEPLPFIMGHYKGVFPGPWIFNKLLAIYDFMAGQRYRYFFNKGIRDYLVPGMNISNIKGATQFSDAVTDDARLVMRVIQAGERDKGLAINYLKAVEVLKAQDKIQGLVLEDLESAERIQVRAKVVINATGVWTDELRAMMGVEQVIRPLRGSHLVVPFWRLPIAFSVSFFHPEDKRPVFAFPWEGVTVIGTTDLDHQADSTKEASISEQEVSYLLAAVNQQFPEANIQQSDIRSTWSGVRPVVSKNTDESVNLDQPAKPSDEKREHAVWDDKGLISVAGGKLTTYRLIAMDVLKKASPYLNLALPKKAKTSQFQSLAQVLKIDTMSLTALSSSAKRRLFGRHGENAQGIIGLIQETPALAEKVESTDTLWAELVWACQAEKVVHLDDLLLRRTRIALLLEHGAKACMPRIKQICQGTLLWDEAKWQAEWTQFQHTMQAHYSLPESRE